MRISLQLNQSLLQDWQSAMLKKKMMETWEIIKNLQDNKLLGNLRLCLLIWAFVPRFSIAAVSNTCSWELMPPLFILFFLPWDLITLDSLLAREHFLTHHNILSFTADSEIHFFPLLPFAVGSDGSWNTPLTGAAPFEVCCAPEKYVCVQRLTSVVSYSLKNNLIIQKGHFSELVI